MGIKELSIEEKIGQMIIIGMDTNYITDRIKTMIKKYKIGGVILYRRNFNTYQEMIKLIKELKELNKENKIPLFISIDQEGGRVNRMPKEIKNLPAANLIAKLGGKESIIKSAEITGELLKKSGFNLNFAPVLDIKRFHDRHALGDRCYGENKEDVTLYGIEVMKTLQKHGIISVIKHFPGHGATKQDSHAFLPIITSKMENVEKEDMYPFEQAIKSGADAMLVGHLLIKNVTGIYPASLSRKFIYKYLRKKYRYNGIIITDDLKMKAIKMLYGEEKAVKKAFEAGNDIIVFRFKQEEERKSVENIINLVKKGKIKESRIDRSVRRIINLKEKYKLSDVSEIEGVNIDDINTKIQEIRNTCNI